MMEKWTKIRLGDIFLFNPAERLAKGAMAKKVAMDKLLPFTRSIGYYELTPYTGGAKFRNGDTLMARITPCLENGKTAWVSILDDNEVGFGSTEYIVLRARESVTDSRFVYYFSINPWFRDIAIKSMVGSSGRQRVQQNVLENLEVRIPPLATQQRIARILGSLDDKIELNRRLNDNLAA
jgi:type I restriction enzyme S subunit